MDQPLETFDPIIEGASDIGAELFGKRDDKTRRRAFYLLERGEVPGAFKLGSIWAIRRSALTAIGRVPVPAE